LIAAVVQDQVPEFRAGFGLLPDAEKAHALVIAGVGVLVGVSG